MRKIILIVSCLFFAGGCYYDVSDELYPGGGSTANCDTTVSGYAAKIAPIMTANCALSGCHVAGATAPDLTTYSEVSVNADKIKQRTIIDKDMPPAGPMSPCDILALEKWINNGALNN